MNPLLLQFLSEARDLLEEVGRGLLSLEQDPGNRDTIDRVFRAMHTIKGGSGLFPYESLTRVVHAAEDVLSAIRTQQVALTRELIDRLLMCVDCVGTWLECIAGTGALPGSAKSDGDRLAGSLRSVLHPGPQAGRNAETGTNDPCRPVNELAPTLRAAAQEHILAGPLHSVRYTPDAQCFFSGEDPLLLLRTLPGLVALEIHGPEAGWAPLSDLDPYRCELRFDLLSTAPRKELEEHFQYVESEVQIRRVEKPPETTPATTPATTKDKSELRMRKSDQIRTLLKVDQSKIDLLMNLVGELIVAKNSLPYLARRAEQQHGAPGLATEIKDQYAVFHRIADALQGAVMQVRMLPLSVVFERFIRMVRDLSHKLDKEVELVTEGEDTEADKSTVDRLGDPLMHLLRNCIDHGIELPALREAAGKRRQGSIRLRATRDSDRLIIEISDDGRGIDPVVVKQKAYDKGLIDENRLSSMSDEEAVKLIFAPGFSTAEAVSDVSGRGVGMDVVRRDIEALGGVVTVHSKKGTGTCVRLVVPLTMSITRILTVQAGGESFGVPMESVVAAVRVKRSTLRQMKQHQVFVWRERLIPVAWLAQVLGLSGPEEQDRSKTTEDKDPAVLPILIVRLPGSEVGMVVDGFQQDVDILLRPLHGILAGHKGYLGTAILGDGRALLVLNLLETLTWH